MTCSNSNRNIFLKWVKGHSHFAAQEVEDICEKVERFCSSKNLLDASFFECTDLGKLEEVKNYIYTNKSFKLFHIMNYGRIYKLLDLYIEFIKCRQIEMYSVEDKVNSFVEDDIEVSDVVNNNEKDVKVVNPQLQMQEKIEDNDFDQVSDNDSFMECINDKTQVKENVASKVDITQNNNENLDISLVDVETPADQLYQMLKKITKYNPYGATSTYLSRCVQVPIAEVETILKDADWAKIEYRRYIFCGSRDNKDMKIDFQKIPSLAFTKPVSLNYFDETYIQVNSWRQLLLKVMECLYEDYPKVIKNLFLNNTSSIVVDSGHKNLLRVPGKISDNTWVELNRSSTEIVHLVKRVLEECNVDYENVTIIYTHLDEHVVKHTNSKESGPLKSSKNIDHVAAAEKQKKDDIDSHIYKEKQVSSGKASHNLTEVDQLLSDELYLPLREELHKQNILSIQKLKEIKLWAFMNQYNLYSIAVRQTVLVNVRHLLLKNSGVDESQLFRINIDNNGFTGESCAEAYMHFCESIANKYPLRIRSLIGKYIEPKHCIALSRIDVYQNSLKMENPIIYIDSGLSVEDAIIYIKWICSMCGEVYNKITIDEPITNTQTRVLPITEETEQKGSCPSNNSSVLTEDGTLIEQVILQADIDGISFNDLQKKLNCTMMATRSYIANCNRIIEIKNRLFHEDAFVDWDDGAEQLDSIIEKLMQKNNGYVSATQLYEFARVEMNMFLNDNDMNDERSLYELAQHLYEKENYHGHHYVFTGKMHISKTGYAIDNKFDVFCKFAEEQGGMFRYEALKEYLEQIGISTSNLRMQLKVYTQPDFLYYEEGVLISTKSMKITHSWKSQVKQALKRLFDDVGDHIIIREIMPFWYDQLPDLPGGKSWTPMLLQSVLRFYSEELGAHTIIAMESQGIETLHTMLVTNDSDIQNFGDVVIAYLRENNIEQKRFETEELRALLVESKMIQGNELIWNMHKALQKDERFAWDAAEKNVTIRV